MLCRAQSLSRVQLFATTWTIVCQAPLSMGIFQARILEWIAISSSRGSSQPRDQIHISCIGRQVLYHRANGKITLSKLVDFQPCYSLVNLGAEGRKVMKKSAKRATDPGREKRDGQQLNITKPCRQ